MGCEPLSPAWKPPISCCALRYSSGITNAALSVKYCGSEKEDDGPVIVWTHMKARRLIGVSVANNPLNIFLASHLVWTLIKKKILSIRFIQLRFSAGYVFFSLSKIFKKKSAFGVENRKLSSSKTHLSNAHNSFTLILDNLKYLEGKKFRKRRLWKICWPPPGGRC